MLKKPNFTQRTGQKAKVILPMLYEGFIEVVNKFKGDDMKYNRVCPSTINIKTHPHLKYVTKIWQTTDGKYYICYDCVNGFKHLRISRIDKKPIHNYMDLQEIKNDLWGKDTIAIEVYPKESEFKNGSNTYHLWTWDNIKVPNLAEMYQYVKEPKTTEC